MSTGYRWEGLRQVCATLLGARHVPERLCGGLVYLDRYDKMFTFTFFTFLVQFIVYIFCQLNDFYFDEILDVLRLFVYQAWRMTLQRLPPSSHVIIRSLIKVKEPRLSEVPYSFIYH